MGEFHRPCGQVIRGCQDGVKFQPLGVERKQQLLGGGDVFGTLADILRPKAYAGISKIPPPSSVKIDKIKQIVGLQNRFLAHLSLDRFPLRC